MLPGGVLCDARSSGGGACAFLGGCAVGLGIEKGEGQGESCWEGGLMLVPTAFCGDIRAHQTYIDNAQQDERTN